MVWHCTTACKVGREALIQLRETDLSLPSHLCFQIWQIALSYWGYCVGWMREQIFTNKMGLFNWLKGIFMFIYWVKGSWPKLLLKTFYQPLRRVSRLGGQTSCMRQIIVFYAMGTLKMSIRLSIVPHCIFIISTCVFKKFTYARYSQSLKDPYFRNMPVWCWIYGTLSY